MNVTILEVQDKIMYVENVIFNRVLFVSNLLKNYVRFLLNEFEISFF